MIKFSSLLCIVATVVLAWGTDVEVDNDQPIFTPPDIYSVEYHLTKADFHNTPVHFAVDKKAGHSLTAHGYRKGT